MTNRHEGPSSGEENTCLKCGEEVRMVWIGFDPPEPYGYVCGCPDDAEDLAEARAEKRVLDQAAFQALGADQ